jgi:hypothetical protein
MPTVTWGWVLLIKHIATFKCYFQSHNSYVCSKKFTFQLGLINLLKSIALCTDVIREGERVKNGGWGRHFIT